MKKGKVVRHLVLDNEAASALLRHGPNDAKRKEVIKAIAAANGNIRVPSAVRVEALWHRGTGVAGDANRLVPDDFDFDGDGANRMVELRTAVPDASVVDAAVALAAEVLGSSGDVVEVLTSDVQDMSALAGVANANIHVEGV